jgi:threonine dehydratase
MSSGAMTSTDLVRTAELDDSGHRVWLCREDHGPLGSFKWRGTEGHCKALAATGERGVVAASTGNFAAAVAWSAQRHGLEAHVVVPVSASGAKLALLEGSNARVHRHGETLLDAAQKACELATGNGLRYFEDGGSPWQLDGIASLGRALAERAPGLAAVVVPVACGALAAGVAHGLRAASSSAAVVGVQARACSRLAARFHGEPDPPSRPGETIADGLADDRIVEPAFGVCQELLSDVVVIDEDDLWDAMRAIHRVTGTVPEAAGAAGLAGLRRWPARVPAGDVAVVVSGANVSREIEQRLVGA